MDTVADFAAILTEELGLTIEIDTDTAAGYRAGCGPRRARPAAPVSTAIVGRRSPPGRMPTRSKQLSPARSNGQSLRARRSLTHSSGRSRATERDAQDRRAHRNRASRRWRRERD